MRIPTLTIPAAEYHAASRRGEYMSSHMLADFRESPALYRKKIAGEVADSESPALALGRATHCLILEGRMAFDEQYVVSDGPVNAKTGESFGRATKAYAEWLSSQDREVVSSRDYGFMVKLQKSVWLHDGASTLLDKGWAEGKRRIPDVGNRVSINIVGYGNNSTQTDILCYCCFIITDAVLIVGCTSDCATHVDTFGTLRTVAVTFCIPDDFPNRLLKCLGKPWGNHAKHKG